MRTGILITAVSLLGRRSVSGAITLLYIPRCCSRVVDTTFDCFILNLPYLLPTFWRCVCHRQGSSLRSRLHGPLSIPR